MKELLKFKIEAACDPVMIDIKLYREEDGLIWRYAGEYGDECESLPRPRSMKEAKEDVKQVFSNPEWKLEAGWI